MNPVFVLDEIDKLGVTGEVTHRSIPEVDPAQNHNFMDHYLDVPI